MRDDVDFMQKEKSRDDVKETHGHEQKPRKKETARGVDGQSGDTVVQ